MKPDAILKSVNDGLKMYADVVKTSPRYPLVAVAEYEDWFKSNFITELTSRLTIEAGRWKATPDSHRVIGIAGKIAIDGCNTILIPVINAWIEREYPKFWQQGLEYNAVMAKMQGYPEPEPINDDDIAQINILVTGEIATQADHVDHHRRYIERNISSGLTLGWTTIRFIESMTVPAGIVGYPYGNLRYSWKTHIERMIEGRSKAVFASASEFRALKAGDK